MTDSPAPVRRRKRPVEVTTLQWTGHNLDDMRTFTVDQFQPIVFADDPHPDAITARVYDVLHNTWVGVKTGQHIIRGTAGEYYPIDEDILAATYEPLGEPA